MFGKLLAMFIGNRIDRRDGKGGVKGALLGLATARMAQGRLGPVGWLGVGVIALWQLFFKRRTKVVTRYR